jgi:hypothetical protein
MSKDPRDAKDADAAGPRPAAGDPDEPLPEYDFRGGVRGKYAARYAEGSNVVVLDPDVAAVFPDARAVNEALRALAGIIRRREAGPRRAS